MMTNKITKAEREKIIDRAKDLATESGLDNLPAVNPTIPDKIAEEFGISQDRAASATAKAGRELYAEKLKSNKE